MLSPDGVALSWMVGVSASVNLPRTRSRSSVLEPAHPGGTGKRAIMVVVEGNNRGTRGHSIKLAKLRCSCDCCKHFFKQGDQQVEWVGSADGWGH